MITFADIEPGAALGECAFAFTEEAASEWTSLFPDDAECLPTMPPAMVAMVVMRAFVTLMRRTGLRATSMRARRSGFHACRH